MRSTVPTVVTVRRTGQFSIYFPAFALFPLATHANAEQRLIAAVGPSDRFFFFFTSAFSQIWHTIHPTDVA
jgi:hypothetical protein